MPNLSELSDLVQPLDRPALALARALQGHVVLMVFWRVGCVHSRQALADVASLPGDHPDDPIAVIAVHVPTVAAERDHDRIRRFTATLADAVTVLLDDDRALAAALDVNALPSLALFDAAGDVCFSGHGEPNRVRLLDAIEALLSMAHDNRHGAKVPFAPPAPALQSALQPTALASDGVHLWVGSAGHRRIYGVTADGRVERTIDGTAAPAGMCVEGTRLFVSDAARHELVAFDLYGDERETVLGTGRRSTDRYGGGFGTDQGLASPAGLCLHEGAIYLAQAGAHQVWQFDPQTQAASAWLGTGARLLRDGGEAAAFAEPVAIAATEFELFVADAGTGALRGIELAHNFARTITQDVERPVAVVVDGDRLLVLDAWRPALLAIAPDGGAVERIFGAADGLVEPAALAVHAGALWIADVGADCLFTVDLTDPEPRLRGVELRELPELAAVEPPAGAAVLAEPVVAQEFSDLLLRLPLPPVAGAPVARGASCAIDLVDEARPVLAADRHAVEKAQADHVEVLVPVADAGEGVLRVRVTVAVGASSRTFRYLLPITVGGSGDLQAELRPVRP